MNYATLEECCTILDHQRIPIKKSERTEGIIPYYGANGLQGYINDYIFDDDLVLLAEDGGAFGSATTPIAYRVSGKCWVNNHAHVLKPMNNINVDYLCYALMFYPVNSLITGTTRKKLTQSAMRKICIPLRSLSEQIQIVCLLKKVEQTINECEQLQKDLDILVKSQFVEMFGDPVANPMGWEVKKLSDIAEYYNGLTYRPEYTSDDGTLVLRSSNIQEGRLAFKDNVFVSCDIREKYFVQKNDILMCSRNGSARLVGKVAIIKDIDEPMAFGSFMMIIRSKLWAYLYVYFQMVAFRRQIITGKTSTINQITGKMLDAVELPVPTEDAVEKFMLFTQLVDKSKLVLRQLLEKQKTLKAALMQEYFS